MPRLSKIGAAALAAFGWTGLSSVNASYLVVAGGGASSNGDRSGGGGAGGYVTGTTSLNTTLSYTVIVGAGGAASYNLAVNGSNSTFSSVVTAAVGGGAGSIDSVTNGFSGGSGGGGGGDSGGTGGAATSGQGNAGGTGNNTHLNSGIGGGGGGGSGAGSSPGNGGAGYTASAALGGGTYAGGGGGGTYNGTAGTGGSGGGGAGGNSSAKGTPGTANTGGGAGGGGSGGSVAGSNGGSGVVIISYPSPQKFGGGIVTTSGSNTIHTFQTSGTLSPLSTLSASYLIVAGGGGGSYDRAGGGGAGGLLTSSGLTLDTNSIYVVTVGAGGSGATSYANGVNGSNSTFSAYATASVGGGGGAYYSGSVGSTGGSGGGGCYTVNGGAGTSGQGYAGGNGESSVYINAGGGGGAGAVGQTPSSSANAGNGGVGVSSSISGTATYYAGGGGGGHDTRAGGSAGAGGNGGGGAGGMSGAGTAGTTNLGGGGGGGGNNGGSSPQVGGAGGSGVVIISYAGSVQQMAGGTVTISGGNVIHTFTSSGYLTPLKLVNNSLRFRQTASGYLSRTATTASNRTTWTYSLWVKRGAPPTNSGNYQSFLSYSPGGTLEDALMFGALNDEKIYFYIYNSGYVGQLVTTQYFRDYAAWYHLVFVWDTTQATSSNRMKIYVNGVQVTAFATANYPSQNATSTINSAVTTWIGRFANTYTDSYLSEINFIDGQALTPNSFGTFNSYGVWQPITYGGSYGTNGFYLPFTNKTSTTTLGYDYSPNGNNWTTNNISLGATVIQSFTSSGTWTAPTGVTSANYLVVAGGAGSSQIGGGGGAGGFLTGALTVVPGTTYTVTVGAGGTGSSANGSNSVFSSVTASGGGYGGGFTGSGGSGGSGGGSGGRGPNAGGSGTSGQGNAGGASTGTGQMGGAGGGGAGAAGSNSGSSGSGLNGANGGNGLASSISGSSVTYAGGGGGANDVSGTTSGSGGSGGGGAGGNQANGTNGTANTGGGGGGSGYPASALTSGGSGIVIISYTNPASSTNDSMTDVPTLTSTTAANYCVLNPIGGFLTGGVSLSNANLTYSLNRTTYNCWTAGSFQMPTTGKYYFETQPQTSSGSTPSSIVGLINSATPNNTSADAAIQRGICTNDGLKISNTTTSAYGSAYALNDIVMVAVDMDNGTIWFGKNGTWFASGNPATNTNPAFTDINSSGYSWFPSILFWKVNTTETGATNFGQRPFVYTPPSGFVALNTYNL